MTPKARISKTRMIALTAMIPLMALASCQQAGDLAEPPVALQADELSPTDARDAPTTGCDCQSDREASRSDIPSFDLPSDGRPAQGPQDAAVTIDVFCDYACSYCKRLSHTLELLRRRHANGVRVVHHQLPLPMHPRARPAALAALAAQRQGAFPRMHRLLFDRQRELDGADFADWADELGLDVFRFERDLGAPVLEQLIDDDLAAASRVGARGTPTAFINGQRIVGARPLSFYEALVAEELQGI